MRQHPGGISRALLLTRKGRPGFAPWLLALLILYGLAVGLALPHFAVSYLERELSRELGVSCTVSRLTVNPFSLRTIARDVRIPYPEATRGKAGEYMLRLERLEVSPSLFSLPYQTLIVNELRLVRPHFSLVRFRDGSLSPQLFFAGGDQAGGIAEAGKEDKDDGLFPIIVHNLAVEDGSMDIRDMLHGTSHTVREIDLTVPFASTLPTDREVPLTPSLSAIVNGKRITVQGESRPFAATRRTVFTLHTSDLSLADFRGYIRPYTHLELISGLLHTELTLRFGQDAERVFDFSLAGNVEIADLVLAGKDGEVFKVESAAVEAENIIFGPRRVSINHVSLENPKIVIRRNKDGVIDWTSFFFMPEETRQNSARIVDGSGEAPPRLRKQENNATPGPPGESGGIPLQLVLKEACVKGGTVVWHDDATRIPVSLSLENLEARFTNISTEGAGQADFSLSFDKGASSFSLSGKSVLRPMRIEAALSANGLALSPLYPYLPEKIGIAPEGGSLSADGVFVFQLQPEPTLQWTNGSASLAGVSLRMPGTDASPLASVSRVSAEGVTLDTARRSLRIGTITGAGIEGILTRGKDGEFVLPAFPKPTAASGPEKAAPWRVAVDALSLTRSSFQLVNSSGRRQTVLPFTDITVTGKGFANHGDKRWALSVSAKPGQRGELALTAEGTLAPLNLTFSGSMDKADMRPLSPLLREISDIRISEATLGGDFSGLVRRLPDTPLGGEFAIKGNLGVYGLSLVHKRKELGGWGRMRIANFDYRASSSGKRTCSIESITVNNPRLLVLIDETGVSSLAAAFRHAGSESGSTPPVPETPRKAETNSAARAKPAFDAFRVDTITVSMGQVNYLDQRVSPPYALKIDQVNATCLNLTLDPNAPVSFVGDFSLNGSPVTASAVVTSLFGTPTGNGTLSIQALDISRFTQYAEKYLGYPLRRGELTMTSLASIKGRELSMHNTVLLRNLDLGKKVDSPFAPDMPLGAAVTLLRDPNGDIGLELPVAGTVGDPEFRIGGVVGRVIGSIVLKTMTSPLAIAGDILGGFFGLFADKGPASAEIVFPIGEDFLDPVAAETLKDLGEELRKRPWATLEVTGIADWSEKNVLIDAWVNKALRARKYEALPAAEKAGASPETVVVGPEHNAREYSRLLFALYENLPFVKLSEDPEVTRPQSTRAIMRIIRSRLDIGEKELRALAHTRAVAVYHALARGNINIAARIRLQKPMILNAEETGGRINSYARISITR